MEQIWWNKVTNAVRFVENISESINSGYSVILQLPKYVPWYASMMEIVNSYIMRDNSTRSFKKECDQGIEPGEYLINKFCKQEVRAHYRPGIGYPRFLAQIKEITLNQSILWVSEVDAVQVKRWHSFITDYNKALEKNKTGGLFVIETNDISLLKETKGIKLISYDDSIEEYDNYVFNMLAAAELKESKLFKQYLSEAVSSMLPDDIELASICISMGRKFLNNPIDKIRKAAKDNYRSDGTVFDVKESDEQLKDRLWRAQIKIIFPLIEEHRNSVISKYKNQIEPLLPLRAAYGEEIDVVSGVELGTIAFLVTTGKIMVDANDSDKIRLLKNMRNTLAHIGVIEQNDIDKLFGF